VEETKERLGCRVRISSFFVEWVCQEHTGSLFQLGLGVRTQQRPDLTRVKGTGGLWPSIPGGEQRPVLKGFVMGGSLL
jgi:hypothetical protein